MLDLDLSTSTNLRTDRLILRELREDDCDVLFAMRNDDVVMEHIGSRKATTLDDAVQMIRITRQDRQDSNGITWGLTVHDDDTLIGHIGYYRLQKEHYRGEVGYLLEKEHWGKGLMSEALVVAVDHGFNNLGFHSIEAVTDPGNKRSISLLLRNGFKQEGLLRENFYFDGKFYDSAVFSKLAAEHAGQ